MPILLTAVPPSQGETTSASGATQIPSSGTAQYTLSVAGTYYLASDINVTYTGNFLNVAVSNVTIDLNGHTITYTGSASYHTNCVYSADHSNITVKNGNINGFWMGVMLKPSGEYADTSSTSYGHLVENVSFTKSVYSAVQIYGYSNRIHRCQSVLGGNTGQSSQSAAFLNLGLYNTVEDCDVMGVFGTNPSYGVLVGTSGNCFAVNNRISGTTYGVYCHDNTDKYRDNLTAGVTTPYASDSGVTPVNAGNNE